MKKKIKKEFLTKYPIWGIYENGERIDFYDRKHGKFDGLNEDEINKIINKK